MKRAEIVLVGVLFLACSSFVTAQKNTNGTGGGKWSVAATWAGNSVPTGSEAITILATDSVYFDVNVSITGSLKNLSGRVGSDSTKTITFGTGVTYEHAANGGSLPKATWGTNSTCLITGAIGNAPSNGNQNFYNLTWDCIGQTGGLNLGMFSNTIGGNVRVIRSNSQYFRLTASNNTVTTGKKTITINGNILVDSTTGFFTSTGSSGTDSMIIILKGSIISYGTFNVANGSGASVNWFVSGDVKALGGAFTTNSTMTRPDSFFFNGTKKQSLMRATSSMSNIQFVVMSGSTVDFDTSSLGGSANTSLALQAGATVISGHAKGLQGNINNGGPVSLSSDANYVYDGVVAQMDSLMPTTVKDLTINNAAGVTLARLTTINGVLHLVAGVFDNTIPFTLGPAGSISYEGGSLKKPTSVENDNLGTIPEKFYVDQNYPNPFNPSTMISYGIPKESFVTVKVYNLLGQEVRNLFAGHQNAGVHTLEFNASHLSSGIYLYRVQAGSVVETKRMAVMK